MIQFDDLRTKAAKVVETAVDATKRAANSARISIRVAAEEEKIKAAYQAIGKLYHQDHAAGGVKEGPAYTEQLNRIAASLERIQELKSQKDVTGTAYSQGGTATEADFVEFEEGNM